MRRRLQGLEGNFRAFPAAVQLIDRLKNRRAHADHRVDAEARRFDQRVDDEKVQRIDHGDGRHIVDLKEGNHLEPAGELLGNDVAGFGGVEAFEAGEVRHHRFDADPFHDFFFGGESQIDQPFGQIFVRSIGGGKRLIELLLGNDADFNQDVAQIGAANTGRRRRWVGKGETISA